eukprot:1145565-Pelagomonas_calceolata.AAC.1
MPTLVNSALQRVALPGRVGHLLEGCVLNSTLELAAFRGDEGMAVKLGLEVVHSSGVHKVEVGSRQHSLAQTACVRQDVALHVLFAAYLTHSIQRPSEKRCTVPYEHLRTDGCQAAERARCTNRVFQAMQILSVPLLWQSAQKHGDLPDFALEV